MNRGTDHYTAPRHASTAPELASLLALSVPAPPVWSTIDAALDAVPLEQRYRALCQLARAPSVFQRLAAYRRLARLYLLDLRYEQRAKRVIADALRSESGLARERVKELLRRC